MSYQDVINTMKERTKDTEPAKIEGINGIFQFQLLGDDGGTFHLKVADGVVEVLEEAADNPSITISMAVADYEDIVAGNLNPTSAFMSGKLKIEGDMSLAMKLSAFTG